MKNDKKQKMCVDELMEENLIGSLFDLKFDSEGDDILSGVCSMTGCSATCP